MDVKRTLIAVAAAVLAASAVAATAPSTELYHDMVVQAIGNNVAVADAGPDSTLYHDM